MRGIIRSRAIWLASLMLAATSCYRTRIDVGGGMQVAPKKTDAVVDASGERWRDGAFYHNVVFGLVDLSGPLPLAGICPMGVDSIEQRVGFLAGLVGAITGNLYSPIDVTVVCKDGKVTRLDRKKLKALVAAR